MLSLPLAAITVGAVCVGVAGMGHGVGDDCVAVAIVKGFGILIILLAVLALLAS